MSGPGLSARGKNNLNKSIAAANFYDPTAVLGLTYRFRASSLLGYSNGAAVSSWQSDVGSLNLTQATALYQPTYLSSGLLSKPAVRFDGIDDVLAVATVNAALPLTYVFIIDLQQVGNDQQIMYGGGPEILLSTSDVWRIYDNGYSDGGTARKGGQVLTANFSASASLYVSGVQILSGNLSGDMSTLMVGGRSTGGNRPLKADMYEILVYSSSLTSSDRARINSYAQATYGITVADNRPPVIDAVSTIPDMTARYRADQVVGQASGSGVSNWPDIGPNLYDAAQLTGASQPAYAANVIGGQPALRFNGTSNFMSSNAPAGDPQQTLVAVMSYTGNTARTIRGTTPGSGLQFRMTASAPQFVKQGVVDIGIGTSLAESTVYALVGTYDSITGRYAFYVNGTISSSGTNAQALSSSTTTNIGQNVNASGEWFAGDILELITYKRVLSRSELARIHGYTQGRYGLVISDSPVSINGLSSWYKADAITGASDGDKVATWPDSSGNNYVTEQPISTNIPIYKTNIVNSKPVIRFGAGGTTAAVRSLAPTWYPSQTTFIVYSTPSVQSGQICLISTGGGSLALLLTNGYLNLIKVGNNDIYTSTTITPTAAFTVIGVTFVNAASLAIYINGTKTDSMTHGYTLVPFDNPTYGYYGAQGIFGGQQFIGDIAEIMTFNRALSTAEISTVDTYLQQRYALTITDRALPITETFTGMNGLAWPNGWTVTSSSPSATGTIQANAGRLSNASTSFQWVNAQLTQMSVMTNMATTGTLSPQASTTGASTSWIYLASDTQDYFVPKNGVFLTVNLDTSGNVTGFGLEKKIANNGTAVAKTYIYKTVTGGSFKFRFERFGPFIRSKIWASSAAEPAGWDITAFDPSIAYMAGRAGVSLGNGNTAYIDYDDITVYAPQVTNLGYAVADSFTRSDQTGLGTSSEIIQTWATDPGWNIVSNAAKWTGTADGNALVNSGLTDNFAIRFTTTSIVTSTYSYGVQLRYVSPTSYIKIFINGSNWNISLSGTLTNIGAATIASGDMVEVQYTGLVIKVLVNNSQQATYTFASAPAASMIHGLIGSANVALTVDDFSIRSLLA